MAPAPPTVSVFAPTLLLGVIVEAGRDVAGPEIHLHPGGQGFWVARMLVRLGDEPVLAAPVGGEAGRILRSLVPSWGIDLAPVAMEADSPTLIEDRRSGERRTIAETPLPVLDRHEADELYGVTLETAATAGVCVLAGLPDGLGFPAETYRRLAADLASAGVRTVADLHGRALAEVLAGGGVDVLKVSEEDLRSDGVLDAGDEAAAFGALAAIGARGARAVVLSRGPDPVLAHVGGRRWRASAPRLEAVEPRGSGDSMTAGLAASVARGFDPERMIRLASAAGAANVTRHGEGSASAELVERLATLVEVEDLGEAR